MAMWMAPAIRGAVAVGRAFEGIGLAPASRPARTELNVSADPRIPSLPRAIEQDPRAQAIRGCLRASLRPVQVDGEVTVPTGDWNSTLANVLRLASTAGAMVRGLEGATQTLMSEARGMAQADARSGVERGARISRLLLVSSDGSERFYRDVATLMRYHGTRLLVIRLNLSGDELGTLVKGAQASTTRALLVTQKDTVTNVLFAIVEKN